MDEATELKTTGQDHNLKLFPFTKMFPHLAGSVPTRMQWTKYCIQLTSSSFIASRHHSHFIFQASHSYISLV